MRTFVQVALLAVIGFLLLAIVIAVGRGDNGALETIALVAAGLLLIAAAVFVRRRFA
jgi:hypothetical protein